MPPQSRGQQWPNGIQQSKSSPNLPTIRALAQQERARLSLDQRERDGGSVPSEASPYTDNNGVNGTDPPSDSDDDATTEEDEENEAHVSDDEFPPLDDDEREELHTTRSHPHLPPSSSQLFPPFYNRPPTPLPPSPSLTSLLRPSFSTHTSHHTTPESSDAESAAGTSTPFPSGSTAHAAASKSASAPRAHPKVPTYEYYGFALYLASSAFFLMYLLWAYLPSPFLHQLGIHYYPNRWWALAVPCWLVVLVAWIYVALASYNTGSLTLAMTNIENVVDEAGQVAVLDREGRIVRRGGRRKGESRYVKARKGPAKQQRSKQGPEQPAEQKAEGYVPADLGSDIQWRGLWAEGTDAVMDVPLGGVCEILYGEGRKRDDEGDADDGYRDSYFE